MERGLTLNLARLFSKERNAVAPVARFGVRPDFPLPGFLANYLAMLTEDDRAAYYHVARDAYTFKGTVLDLGTFAGGTTAALAYGILNNERYRSEIQRLPLIHARDLYKADHAAILGLNWAYPDRHFKEGDDFLDVFVSRLGPLMSLIDVKQGDIMHENYLNEPPIEVLGLDLCKTRDINDHVVRTFFPHLMPGAHVLHQDFLHAWLPHIHVSMGYFADRFRVVHECHDGGTVVFEATAPIRLDEIDAFSAACSHDKSRWVELFDRCLSQLKTERSRMRCAPARALIIGEALGLKAAKKYADQVRGSLDEERTKELDQVISYIPQVSNVP